jgi:uncharacterized protein (TIGR02594 family)
MALPKWLETAKALVGTQEIPGPAHNPLIVKWLAKLNAWWRNDETAWCGVFAAHCMQEAGLPYPTHYYRAKAWADYGSLLRRDRLSPGAILVFERKGGGHVGFYVAEDTAFFYVLGGNQANSVNVMKIAKSRCIASRWPKGVPVNGKPIYRNGGAAVSDNEA